MAWNSMVAAVWIGITFWRAALALGTLRSGLSALAHTHNLPVEESRPYIDIAKASALIALVEMLFAGLCLAVAVTAWFAPLPK